MTRRRLLERNVWCAVGDAARIACASACARAETARGSARPCFYRGGSDGYLALTTMFSLAAWVVVDSLSVPRPPRSNLTTSGYSSCRSSDRRYFVSGCEAEPGADAARPGFRAAHRGSVRPTGCCVWPRCRACCCSTRTPSARAPTGRPGAPAAADKTAETVMFQMIGLGFVLLTLTVASGVFFSEETFGPAV